MSNFKWVCEFCFKVCNENNLPEMWDLVWQSAVCPECQERVKADGGYDVVKGGAYAKGPDPRSPKYQHDRNLQGFKNGTEKKIEYEILDKYYDYMKETGKSPKYLILSHPAFYELKERASYSPTLTRNDSEFYNMKICLIQQADLEARFIEVAA